MEEVATLLMVEVMGGLKSSTDWLDVNPAGRSTNEVEVADGGSTLRSILIEEEVGEGAACSVAVELGDAVVKDVGLCKGSAHGQATML